MRPALICTFGIGLACGGTADGDQPQAEAAPAPSGGRVEAPPSSPAAKEDLPPVAAEVEPAAEPKPAPGPADDASFAQLGQTVPQVPAVLPPVPADAVSVYATTGEVRVGEVSVPLSARTLPTTKALQPIDEALAKTKGPVAIVADEAVSAVAVRRIVGLVPQSRPRVLVVRAADGSERGLPLVARPAKDAAEVLIATDGFHLAERKGGPQVHLKPGEDGYPFDYVALRNKAKAFRTQHPDVESVRVGVEPEVSTAVLLRALSQLRGPKCTEEPKRCWLPQLAFGDDVETDAPSGVATIDLGGSSGDKGVRGKVKLGKAKVPDSLDADEVRKALSRRIGYARMCYSAALQENPTLSGRVVLRLTVDANGDVEEVGVPKTTLKNFAVEDCLERGGKGLHLTAPTKAPAMVDVPLTFEPK